MYVVCVMGIVLSIFILQLLLMNCSKHCWIFQQVFLLSPCCNMCIVGSCFAWTNVYLHCLFVLCIVRLRSFDAIFSVFQLVSLYLTYSLSIHSVCHFPFRQTISLFLYFCPIHKGWLGWYLLVILCFFASWMCRCGVAFRIQLQLPHWL